MPSNKPKITISDSDEREFQQMSKDVMRELQEAGFYDKKGRLIRSRPPLNDISN